MFHGAAWSTSSRIENMPSMEWCNGRGCMGGVRTIFLRDASISRCETLFLDYISYLEPSMEFMEDYLSWLRSAPPGRERDHDIRLIERTIQEHR